MPQKKKSFAVSQIDPLSLDFDLIFCEVFKPFQPTF